MTSEERTKKNYERRPYPRTEINLLVEKDTSLPASRWMQAIGRPGRAAPKRVLVAGCATGVEAFILRRRWPTAEIVAVDFSPRSIAVARKLQRTVVTGKPITFRVADLTDENLVRSVGGDYDLITCHGVLSYIPEPVRVLKNLAPALRADGALLVKCFHGSGYSQLVELFKRSFTKVAVRKPKASRDESAETYLLGRGPKPNPVL